MSEGGSVRRKHKRYTHVSRRLTRHTSADPVTLYDSGSSDEEDGPPNMSNILFSEGRRKSVMSLSHFSDPGGTTGSSEESGAEAVRCSVLEASASVASLNSLDSVGSVDVLDGVKPRRGEHVKRTKAAAKEHEAALGLLEKTFGKRLRANAEQLKSEQARVLKQAQSEEAKKVKELKKLAKKVAGGGESRLDDDLAKLSALLREGAEQSAKHVRCEHDLKRVGVQLEWLAGRLDADLQHADRMYELDTQVLEASSQDDLKALAAEQRRQWKVESRRLPEELKALVKRRKKEKNPMPTEELRRAEDGVKGELEALKTAHVKEEEELRRSQAETAAAILARRDALVANTKAEAGAKEAALKAEQMELVKTLRELEELLSARSSTIKSS